MAVGGIHEHLAQAVPSTSALCKVVLATALALASQCASAANACQYSWDGDALVSQFAGDGRPFRVNLRIGSTAEVYESVSVAQVTAFYEAKRRIAQYSGVDPKLLICSDRDPNAFATNGQSGPVMGVTIGMLTFANGDSDLAAFVVGHELAHHVRHHMADQQSARAVVGLLAALAGAVIENKINQRTNGNAQGNGFRIAGATGELFTAKYGRDQEREADELGLTMMVKAGYDPNGATRLSQRMRALGLGGAGLFYDNHPGWDEREQKIAALIASNPEAQRLARAGQRPSPANDVAIASTEDVALLKSRSDVALDAVANPASLTPPDAYAMALRVFAAKLVDGYPAALKALQSSAERGFPLAQDQLGLLYQKGALGLEKSPSEAVRLFKLAADQGNHWAEARVGYAYMNGTGGLTKDLSLATDLFFRSAKGGNPLGQTNLGFFYLTGIGTIAKDEGEALRLFRLAAEQKLPLALNNLGVMYTSGLGGLPKDDAQAVHYYQLAVEKNEPIAQANLGLAYANGRGGLDRNDVEAVRLYKLSSGAGNSAGEAYLASMYFDGRGGLARDDGEAVRLIRLALDAQHPAALYLMGYALETGRGVDKNTYAAIEYYRRSAARGNKLAADKVTALLK